MSFSSAFSFMRNGFDVRLPEWGGYWYWDDVANSIMMVLKTGETLDIRETTDVLFTIQNTLRNDWLLASEE